MLLLWCGQYQSNTAVSQFCGRIVRVSALDAEVVRCYVETLLVDGLNNE